MGKSIAVLGLAALMAGGVVVAHAQEMEEMTFFITSAGPGDGANLDGLAGADAICAALAEGAGGGDKIWRAYLSSSEENARDRIGNGPWHNAKGVLIAANLDDLHGEANAISKETGLTEKGEMVNGRGDSPNEHDILTGSNADGTYAEDMTCGDWTLNGEGSAMVGHHDRMGLRDDAPSKSWNASHPSRGCGQEALRGTGGNGYFYCFAVN